MACNLEILSSTGRKYAQHSFSGP